MKAKTEIIISNYLAEKQKSAIIVGASRSCPREAPNALAHVIPVDFHIKKTATISAFKLNESGRWRETNYGHTSLLLRQTQFISGTTDYIAPTVNFKSNFAPLFSSREEWSKRFSLKNFDTAVYAVG